MWTFKQSIKDVELGFVWWRWDVEGFIARSAFTKRADSVGTELAKSDLGEVLLLCRFYFYENKKMKWEVQSNNISALQG